jgi:hypothetical protein
MYTYTLVSYPNSVNPTKKYPMRNMVKLMANAHTNIDVMTMMMMSKRMDLLPIFEAK